MILKKHCEIRLSERSVLTHYDIDIILKNKSYLRIGMDIKKKNICHYLFYSIKDQKHFILLVDENSQEAISILPDNYAAWQISNDAFSQTQAIAIAHQKIHDCLNKEYELVHRFRRLVCGGASKTKWNQFLKENFNYLQPLLSFDNLDIDSKGTLSSKIIFYFLKYCQQPNEHIIENINDKQSLHNFSQNISISELKNYTFSIYINSYKIEHNYKCSDFNPNIIDKNIIKHFIKKSNKKLCYDQLLYILVSLDGKDQGIFVPNIHGLDYIPFDKYSAQLTSIKVHCENQIINVSHKRLRHLQKQHFTDFFNKNCALQFVRFLIKQKLANSIPFNFVEFTFEDQYEKDTLILNKN